MSWHVNLSGYISILFLPEAANKSIRKVVVGFFFSVLMVGENTLWY